MRSLSPNEKDHLGERPESTKSPGWQSHTHHHCCHELLCSFTLQLRDDKSVPSHSDPLRTPAQIMFSNASRLPLWIVNFSQECVGGSMCNRRGVRRFFLSSKKKTRQDHPSAVRRSDGFRVETWVLALVPSMCQFRQVGTRPGTRGPRAPELTSANSLVSMFPVIRTYMQGAPEASAGTPWQQCQPRRSNPRRIQRKRWNHPRRSRARRGTLSPSIPHLLLEFTL